MYRDGWTTSRNVAGSMRTLLVACATAVVTACTTAPPPVQQMSDARQAIAAARDAGADTHAPQVLSRSVRLMSLAEATLARRNYRLAGDQATLARQLAIEAMEQAATRSARDRR